MIFCTGTDAIIINEIYYKIKNENNDGQQVFSCAGSGFRGMGWKWGSFAMVLTSSWASRENIPLPVNRLPPSKGELQPTLSFARKHPPADKPAAPFKGGMCFVRLLCSSQWRDFICVRDSSGYPATSPWASLVPLQEPPRRGGQVSRGEEKRCGL